MAKPLFTARSKEAENIPNTKKWKMIFLLLCSSKSIVLQLNTEP